MRSASSALLAIALVACGGGAGRVSGEVEVAFRDEGATMQSSHTDAEPRIEAAADGDRWRITAHQGQQRTGGYAIRVERVKLVGAELRVTARFTVPPPDALVIQVLTSPAHTVSLAATFDRVVLFDQDGRERARVALR